MTRRGLVLLMLSVLPLAGGTIAAPEHLQVGNPGEFIEAALRGIGAQETSCPALIVEETRSRDLSVTCATFEGDFESFRSRWAEWTSEARPRTGWAVNGANYDRIYAFGAQAVGVRFTLGEILIVYK